MYQSIPSERLVTGLGMVCIVPSGVASLPLRCDTEDLAELAIAIGSVVTRADARDAIKTAVQSAARWLLTRRLTPRHTQQKVPEASSCALSPRRHSV